MTQENILGVLFKRIVAKSKLCPYDSKNPLPGMRFHQR